APSVTVLAKRLYGRSYKNLPLRKKQKVKLLQRREWQWEHHHNDGRVYSTLCAQTLEASDIDGPCFSCFSLLQLKGFRVAISVPKPKIVNYKYLNKEYCNINLGTFLAQSMGLEELIQEVRNILSMDFELPSESLYIGFIKNSSFEDQFFSDLLRVINMIQDKKDRGTGMQGFQWS
ncbi:hypothetical protein C8R41DRAFT_710308, partial [Lentinula lateritia]